MFASIPAYYIAVPVLAATAGAGGYIWYRKWRATRIDIRSAAYLKAIGKLARAHAIAQEAQIPVHEEAPIWTPQAPLESREEEAAFKSMIPDHVYEAETLLPPPQTVTVQATVATEKQGEPSAADGKHPDLSVVAKAKKPGAIAGLLSRLRPKTGVRSGDTRLQALSKSVVRSATLPKVYERGLIMLYRPAGTLPRSAKPEFLLPWTIAQARGGDVAPAYKDLTAKEVRLVELTLLAITEGELAFTAVRDRATASEQAFLDHIRPIARSNARETLEHLHGGMKARVDRMIAKAEKSIPPPVIRPLMTRRPFLHVSELGTWLPAAADDVELWHMLVAGLDVTDENVLSIVKWIVEKPCDQATAALALLRVGAVEQATHKTNQGRYGAEAAAWMICRIICQRSQAGEYPTRKFNLASGGFDNDQTGYAVRLVQAAGEHPLPWPEPTELLARPFDGRDAYCERFDLIGDTLYHRPKSIAA